jgi:hypothetical protein
MGYRVRVSISMTVTTNVDGMLSHRIVVLKKTWWSELSWEKKFAAGPTGITLRETASESSVINSRESVFSRILKSEGGYWVPETLVEQSKTWNEHGSGTLIGA